VEFGQSFVDHPRLPNEHVRKKELTHKLSHEAPGILAWLVRGCLEWQRIGLNPPLSVQAATKEYQKEVDELGEFIETLVHNPKCKTQASALFAEYEAFCNANGVDIMNKTVFGKKMTKRYEKKRSGGLYFYIGIGLPTGDSCDS